MIGLGANDPSHPPPPGPANRTTFFAEQARNRRQARRFAAVATITVGLTGIPLSILVTPALYLVTLTAAHLTQLVTPLPPTFWAGVARIGNLLPTVGREIIDAVDRRSLAGIDWSATAGLVGALVVPGILVMLLLWAWVRLALAQAGTSGVVLRVGARVPDETSLEERQLVNLIEEMAIASGLKPPRVMLLDVDAVNAAAVGVGRDQATLVVTRGLLQHLDRKETQGIIAHLIGSVGNGDLRILNLLLSVFHTFGLLGVLLHGFGSRGARRTLWRTFRTILRRGDGAEAERLAELLATNTGSDEAGGKDGCLSLMIAPFVVAGGAVQLLVSLGASFLFGPPLTAMWRARRSLADSTAVQLTRDPNTIAHALQRLATAPVEFAGGAASRILFVHWPSYVGGSGDLSQAGRLHPNLGSRIKRLEASGATLRRGPDRPSERTPLWRRALGGLLGLIGSLLWGAVVALMVGVGAFVSVLAFGMLGAAIFVIHAFFTNLPAMIEFVRTDLPAIAIGLWNAVRQLIAAATAG